MSEYITHSSFMFLTLHIAHSSFMFLTLLLCFLVGENIVVKDYNDPVDIVLKDTIY